jgi:hypothetical protein
MPTTPANDIDVACIVGVRAAQRAAQARFGEGQNNQMYVIGQQAVAPNLQLIAIGLFEQRIQVGDAIAVMKEDVAAVVPTLGDVVRSAYCYHSSLARHMVNVL